MKERKTVPGVLFIGLLVAAILLAGFNLAPNSIGSFQTAGNQSNPPDTMQIEMLKQGIAAVSNPVEGGKSQLGPDATVGQKGAMLAAELLLNFGGFNVEIPLMIK